MNSREAKVVSVFGANEGTAGDSRYSLAREVGRQLAELGYTIANGGYGGTMEASARGAKAAGGSTIGVMCSIWSSEPNRYIDERVETTSLLDRLAKLIELGTGGYVVLPGATGTLVELATVWEMICKKLLPRRPLVCVGGFWQPLIEMMTAARATSRNVISTIESPEKLKEHFPAC